MKKTLEIFINNRQNVLNTFKKYEKNGICIVSQKQIADELGLSQIRISQLIKSINSEEKVILKGKKLCTYVIKNYNFKENKMLKIVIHIIESYENGNTYCIEINENDVSKALNCKKSTIQCAKAIIKTSI